jgi:hypothetical protein
MSIKSELSVSMQKNSMKLGSETLMVAQLLLKFPFLFSGSRNYVTAFRGVCSSALSSVN